MEQIVEVGDVWVAKDQPELEIEVFDISGDTVVCKLVKDWGGYVKGELVTYTKNTLFRIYAKEVDKACFDAYQEGYRFGHSDAKKECLKLAEKERSEVYSSGWNDGYQLAKRDRKKSEGYEEGFDDGYNSAIKEMKSEKLNSGVCGSNVPNKETQEAMQEVSDEDLNEFEGVWVAKDGSGKIKVLSINEGTCDVELVEHIKDSFLCIGDTATISIDDLKEHWTKERAKCKGITTKDYQLKKELELVEKYPHYYKDIRHLNIIDIYRFFDLFEVTDPCIQHSTKKLAVGGKRGAKDYEKDIKEAMDTLKRWEYMQEENKRGLDD